MQNDGIRKLIVTDIDDNVSNRFERLIGAGLSARYEFDKQSFEDLGRFSGLKIFESSA